MAAGGKSHARRLQICVATWYRGRVKLRGHSCSILETYIHVVIEQVSGLNLTPFALSPLRVVL